MTAHKKKTNSKWDLRFIELAEFISKWSKDRAKVGAAIVTKEGGPIALGYNGFPAGVEDDKRLDNKDLKLEMIIHAEQNALLTAGTRAKGATLYVWGKPICSRCAVVIIQAGISRIVLTNPEDEKDKASIWYTKGVLAIKMFKEAGIEIKYYKAKGAGAKRNITFPEGISTNHEEIALTTPSPYQGEVSKHGTPRNAGEMCSVVEAANYFSLPPLLYRCGDWAICEDGIHCLYIQYYISKSRLNEDDWIEHVTEKSWVIRSDFIDAFEKAKEILR